MVSFTLGYMHMSPDQVEQIKTPDHIDTPKTVKDVETQSVIDLFAIELDTNKNLIVPEELKDIVDDVMQDPQQPPEQEDQEKIGDMLKKWKISEAVSKALDMIFSIFAGSKKKAWLEDFKKYTTDYSSMTQEKLDETINWLQNRVKQSWLSIHQKLRFTYAFSRAKDEKLTRENPQSTAFDKLAKNIQPGDVLLMNKDGVAKTAMDSIKGKIVNEWLQQASYSIRTHIVIVTKVSGNDIEITQGTTPVVKTDDLQSYLKQYKAVDVCTLQQPPASRKNSIDYARTLIGKPYDSKAAANQTLTWTNIRDDKYNCGELVAEALYHANPTKFKGLEDKTFPSDFLMGNYLQPAYMTTIVS